MRNHGAHVRGSAILMKWAPEGRQLLTPCMAEQRLTPEPTTEVYMLQEELMSYAWILLGRMEGGGVHPQNSIMEAQTQNRILLS